MYERIGKSNRDLMSNAGIEKPTGIFTPKSLKLLKSNSVMAYSEIFPLKTEESAKAKLSKLNNSLKKEGLSYYSGDVFYCPEKCRKEEAIQHQTKVITNIQGNRNSLNKKLSSGFLSNQKSTSSLQNKTNRRYSSIHDAGLVSLKGSDNLANEKIDSERFSPSKTTKSANFLHEELVKSQYKQNSVMEYLRRGNK